jgi:hypothetical protein
MSKYTKDYFDFPPCQHFMRVLKACPQSAYLYTQLWKNKDKQMAINTMKKDVRKEYLISPTMFRNLLAPLMFLNLISFIEDEGKIKININGGSSSNDI